MRSDARYNLNDDVSFSVPVLNRTRLRFKLQECDNAWKWRNIGVKFRVTFNATHMVEPLWQHLANF